MSQELKEVLALVNLHAGALGWILATDVVESSVFWKVLACLSVLFLLYFTVKLSQEASEQPYVDSLKDRVLNYENRWLEACACYGELAKELQEKQRYIEELEKRFADRKQTVVNEEYDRVKKQMMDSGLDPAAASDFAMESTGAFFDEEET